MLRMGRRMLAIGVTCGHNSLLPLDKATDSIEVRVRPLDALLPSRNPSGAGEN